VGASEVWAVGDGSTVLRHDGQAWSVVSVPGLPAELSLRGVAVRGSDVWIVGDDATLFERRGGSWQEVLVDGFGDSLRAVWAGDDSVWAVGNAGSVLRLDDGEWARVSSGTGRDLHAVHGHGDDVWFAGEQGEIRSWNPEEERFERPVGEGAPGADLTALQVAADGSVRVTGSSGVIDIWAAGATCAVEGDAGAPPEPCPGWGDARLSGQSVALRGLWASGEQLLAVGDQGAIVRFDGPTRSVESPASADNFLAVAGAGSSVWVAGDRLLRREANRWRELQRDSPRALYAVQPLDDRLLVAGTGGVVRRYAGDEWEAMDARADAWLRGLWSDGQTGWLVGSRGYAWGLLNQSLWTELTTPTDRDLLDVWATASGVAWAVGADGVILRHDGRGWAAIPSGPDGGVRVDLGAIWGADDDLWAVGTGGTILHWNGTLWARISDEAPFSLNGVWGRSPTEIWAVGSGGVILRYDGSSWSEERSGTGYALNDVWGDGSRLWAVGERGTILVKTLD
jgi:hypothetical protein